MKAKEVLKILKISRVTLCKYVKDRKLKVVKLPSGQYDYDENSVFKLYGLEEDRKAVIYARVSTQKQKKDLQNQIDCIKEHANKNGIRISKIYSDIASGLNYDRGQFQELLNEVLAYKIKVVYISNKDRLTRISYKMWKDLFAKYKCELKVINEDESQNENDEKEIFADIISMLHCFAMKMYSSRRKKKVELVKEDLENEISEGV